MKPDGMDELKELIAFLKENEIAEFDLDRGDLKVRLKFASGVVHPVQAAPVASGLDMATLARLIGSGGAPAAVHAAPVGAPAAPAAPTIPAAAPVEEEKLHIIKSPIVGTFYESPSPGSSAFVSNGDRIEKGQVVCIVEAMKLMNEIEAESAGTVVEIFAQNGKSVEYGQKLFRIKKA